ncbi:MAG: hypothetical protein IT462_00425 [Planctomycetes bacterium]|nr:hypothetical protein [Planctomycetota bacterium]
MIRKVVFPGLMALVLAVAVCSTSSVNAEWPGYPRPEAGQPPVDVVRTGGKVVWKVRGSGTVKLHDVLTMYADSFDKRSVYFDKNVFQNKDCTFAAPSAGVEYSADDVETFVGNLLRQHGLALLRLSAGHEAVVNQVDAVLNGRVIEEKELAPLSASEMVNYVIPLKHTDANTVAGTLRAVVRQPNFVMPMSGNIFVGGRAEDVRSVVKMIAVLDKPRVDEMTLKRHELAEGVDANELLVVIKQIMPPVVPGSHAPITATNATFAVAKKAILVRGTAADHKLVDEVIALYASK